MLVDYYWNYCPFFMTYCFQRCLNISFKDREELKYFDFSLQKVKNNKIKEVERSSFSYQEETLCALVSVQEGEQEGFSPILAVSQSHQGPNLKVSMQIHNIGNKQQEFEMCGCLQGYDLTGIIEIWYDGSYDWSVEVEGYRILRKDGQGT